MRTSTFREPFMPLAGLAVIPASANGLPPSLTENNECALSMDLSSNLRVVLPASPATSVVDVGGVASTITVVGSVTTPGAGVTIASLAVTNGGVYSVQVLAGYGATAGALNDMNFQNNASIVGALYVIPLANAGPTMTWFARVVGGSGPLTVNAVAGGAGVYVASITATRVS